VLTKSFHSCNPHAWPTVLGSSHASAVAPRVSLQARSCHKEDSTRGFIAPSLKPRAEFSSGHPTKEAALPQPITNEAPIRQDGENRRGYAGAYTRTSEDLTFHTLG
jgi:hypothetical protein